MSEHILIAFIGAVINMLLALIIPCLLKNSQTPLLVNIKKVYETHKQVIITSSVIIFITIYLALKLTPELGISFDDFDDFNNFDNFDNLQKSNNLNYAK
jgi:hypothetical protein